MAFVSLFFHLPFPKYSHSSSPKVGIPFSSFLVASSAAFLAASSAASAAAASAAAASASAEVGGGITGGGGVPTSTSKGGKSLGSRSISIGSPFGP